MAVESVRSASNFARDVTERVCVARREFADYVSTVADPQHARIVAVTSPERAEAAQKERPEFFNEITKIL